LRKGKRKSWIPKFLEIAKTKSSQKLPMRFMALGPIFLSFLAECKEFCQWKSRHERVMLTLPGSEVIAGTGKIPDMIWMN
jgi:hypothetical protein